MLAPDEKLALISARLRPAARTSSFIAEYRRESCSVAPSARTIFDPENTSAANDVKRAKFT
jgi:hypothetical protein